MQLPAEGYGRVAVHEAGHVLALIRAGGTLEAVELDLQLGQGRTTGSPAPVGPDSAVREWLEVTLIQNVAGGLAESRWTNMEDVPLFGDNAPLPSLRDLPAQSTFREDVPNILCAARMIDPDDPDGAARAAIGRANEILDAAGASEAIAAIADALLSKSRLEEGDVAVLLGS